MPARMRPVDKPIAWVGHDRILLDDRTATGLRRKVIARKEDMPNCVTWLQVAFQEAERSSPSTKVHWWLVFKKDRFFYLWIVWKEG